MVFQVKSGILETKKIYKLQVIIDRQLMIEPAVSLYTLGM